MGIGFQMDWGRGARSNVWAEAGVSALLSGPLNWCWYNAPQMSLTPGTRVGPYEIMAPLGEGGMGVVWRARDTQLLREVALKLLPGHFANDPDRVGRFQREAQILASLNHANIAHV